ncbi:hypothetical protein F5Y04DRAFT_283681 [Hypomontagnella monticulosa]|nr:hypothetical protein F5Y04DRAFT_283681 [Hypomontagnella monticulosa]
MCSEVLFTYRCGCTEHTLFECPDSAPHSCCRHRCPGPGDCIETKLDEDCHDCSQVAKRRPFMYDEPAYFSFPPFTTGAGAGILRERSLNLPSKRPPDWVDFSLVGPQYLAGHGSLSHYS